MEKIIAIAAPILVTALLLGFNEGIKERIKKSVSNGSPANVMRLFVGLFVLILLLSLIPGAAILASETATESQSDIVVETETKKTDLELGVDAATYVYEEVKVGIDNKKERDSIFIANRSQYWVYQIGNPREDESEAWNVANSLSSVSGICIFKESKKSYLIICDRGATEISDESLVAFTSAVDSILPDQRIVKLNIMGKCGKKEAIKEIDNISKRKHDEEYRCLTCDK